MDSGSVVTKEIASLEKDGILRFFRQGLCHKTASKKRKKESNIYYSLMAEVV